MAALIAFRVRNGVGHGTSIQLPSNFLSLQWKCVTADLPMLKITRPTGLTTSKCIAPGRQELSANYQAKEKTSLSMSGPTSFRVRFSLWFRQIGPGYHM